MVVQVLWSWWLAESGVVYGVLVVEGVGGKQLETVAWEACDR